MSFFSSLVAKEARAKANSTATKKPNTSSVNPLVSAINRAASASKSISSKITPVSSNPVSSAIKKASSDSGTAKTLAPKILTPQSGAVAGVSDKVTTLSPKILTTDKTSTPTNNKASEIEAEIRRKKIIAEGKALEKKQLEEKVASNSANAVAKETKNTEQPSIVSSSVVPGVDYKSLMDKAVAQQQRNAAVNTAQTRNLAQEQAYQAGAKVGSADAANYVNRAMAQADAANVAGAQGLQDSLLSYQKSAESQQNWQKQFDQSSKQADLANERARYDQIVSAIGSDNPDALSYFAKQYLGGVPIDKAYSDTLTKGFTAKTAKDKAYDELETWHPEIDQYLKIQKEQGQVAADNYLTANPVPTKFIPTNTASDAAVQSQAIANVSNWNDNLSLDTKDAAFRDSFVNPPKQDLIIAVQSGNKNALKQIDSRSTSVAGKPGTQKFWDSYSSVTLSGGWRSKRSPILKAEDGSYYVVGKSGEYVVFTNLNTGVPILMKESDFAV